MTRYSKRCGHSLRKKGLEVEFSYDKIPDKKHVTIFLEACVFLALIFIAGARYSAITPHLLLLTKCVI